MTVFPNPSVPQVTITDTEALDALPFEAVSRYMEATGWEYRGDNPVGAAVYAAPTWADSYIAVPPANTYSDHSYLMGKAITEIAGVESRSELLVYWDILDVARGTPTRGASVVSGEMLAQVQRIFNVNVDGLEFCEDCSGPEGCDGCESCMDCGLSGAGCDNEEIELTGAIGLYIEPRTTPAVKPD